MPAPGTTTSAANVDYRAITTRHRAAWAVGDFARGDVVPVNFRIVYS